MSDREDEFKELEKEMVEKGSAVQPIERYEEPGPDDIERALEESLSMSDEDEPTFVSPEEQAIKRKRKKRIILVIVLIILLAGAAVGGYFVYRMLGPSMTKADVASSFELGENEVGLIIDGVRSEKKGRVIDGKTYIPYDIAGSYMDNRLYVDTTEKLLSYATEEAVTDYPLDAEADGVKVLIESDGEFYIALDFIAKNATCEYTEYTDPARIAIFHDRTKTYTIMTIGEDSYMRTGPGEKYPYLIEVKSGDELFADTEHQKENDFQPVTTRDGITGYVPIAVIRKSESRPVDFTSEPTTFTQLSLGEKLCMGWHNIGSAGHSELPVNLGIADCINVLAPTWFTLDDNKGGISSIADHTYVASAHEAGRKVWPTLRDFTSDKTFNLTKILGKTRSRRRLIKNVVDALKELGCDGINVDFEKVTADSAAGYLEFLRELVIECHKEQWIVSTDNYPIREYNMFYNPSEQGRVVDYVIFMAYDEHYSGSNEAGSVSSLLYVQDAIAKGVGRMSKDRVVIGLPFFTRLWLEKETKNGMELSSEVMGMGDAETWLWKNEAKANWDKELGQYYAELKVGKKKTYRIWMENERSIKAKIAEATSQDIAGVAFWSMGSERAITWETISEALK
ncbi:MAG: hypothetical protein J5819_02090 [Eubacterium sp.]|nr:hypothetical protein [Eubacterium sp.]